MRRGLTERYGMEEKLGVKAREEMNLPGWGSLCSLNRDGYGNV